MAARTWAVSFVSWLMIAALMTVLLVIGLELNNVEVINKTTKHRAEVVLSGSMSPRIDPGSLIIIREADAKDLSKGDVITFRGDDTAQSLITHRIYGVMGKNGLTSGFMTKGDANSSADAEVVKPELVVGRLVAVIPYAGYIVQTIKSEIGYFLLVLIPGLIIITSEITNLIERIRNSPKAVS